MPDAPSMKNIAAEARRATSALAVLDPQTKNKALEAVASALLAGRENIMRENAEDLARAEKNGMSAAMIDRLAIDDKRLTAMAQGIRQVAALEDPVGKTAPFSTRPNGLRVEKMRIPLGVIGIVYESRPNVTADAAALCLKSGNAVILRGGSEALRSNIAIGEVIRDCLKENGIPPAAVSVVPDADRKLVLDMLKLDGFIDLIIPRGGEALIEFVVENSAIPVLKHYKGVCHVFVDEFADIPMAVDICVNAKVQRPGVCNAMETMLVDEKIAAEFLPAVWNELREKGVSLKGCPETCSIIPDAAPATDEDWDTEYLAPVLNARVVKGVGGAMEHIAAHGSMHTDCIVTEDGDNARRFLRGVESSAVMHNASTRFNDGFELGMGAEIGISTTKIHAFGPMGLEELTSEKFIVKGEGQVRE
ncbi:MAG: glutamate-5-semialdehyde dehydrogenase [Candidatus Dadabacteria bacterium]|nr:glutamate-5-semialdehyde dehydrogenase [Candidatus Dadabacteria bacterium]